MCIDFLKSFFPHCWLVLLDFCKKRDFGYIIKLFLLLFQAFFPGIRQADSSSCWFQGFFLSVFYLIDLSKGSQCVL